MENEMSVINHIIEPERIGIWVAVTFTIALLALVLALVGVNRITNSAYITQTEVLLLNKKINNLTPAPAVAAVPQK
jgi:hypothetical protein